MQTNHLYFQNRGVVKMRKRALQHRWPKGGEGHSGEIVCIGREVDSNYAEITTQMPFKCFLNSIQYGCLPCAVSPSKHDYVERSARFVGK